jgi:uncharacterized membrane protein YdjX (TVP38/TMEM64 family)
MGASEISPGKTGRWRDVVIVLAALGIFALIYFLWPAFGAGVREVTSLIGHGDMVGLKAYLLSFGAWAPVVSALVMVLQAVVAPLPAFVVAMANGLLFGAFWGTLLTWSTAMVGAVICFYLARALGRPAVERLVSRLAMNSVDDFFRRYGNNSVLIARLIPLLSFSAISYVAGVTSISFWGYLGATAVGLLPGTIVFCVMGQNMTNLTRFIFYAVTGIAALTVLGLTLRQTLNRRLARQESIAAAPGQKAED